MTQPTFVEDPFQGEVPLAVFPEPCGLCLGEPAFGNCMHSAGVEAPRTALKHIRLPEKFCFAPQVENDSVKYRYVHLFDMPKLVRERNARRDKNCLEGPSRFLPGGDAVKRRAMAGGEEGP